MMAVVGRVAAIAVLALSAACSQKPANPAREDAEMAGDSAVAPAAVAAATRVVQADTDTAPTAMHGLLVQLAAAGQASSGDLAITFGGDTVPLDWWLAGRRLIEPTGSDGGGQTTFRLTAAGLALAQKPPSWLTATPALDPTSRCHADGSLTASRCELKAVYTLAPTAVGRALTAQEPLVPMTVAISASSDGKVWTADAADYGQGVPAGLAGLRALLGAPEGWSAAREAFLTNLANPRVTSGVAPPQATVGGQPDARPKPRPADDPDALPY